MTKDTAMLVTSVKNEGPNILEWVAHHRLCGFDHIQVYQNDSSDSTVQTLRTLDRLGVIEFHNNRHSKGAHQKRAYRRASRSAAFQNSTWCMALDTDEFLNVKTGDRTVQALVDTCPTDTTAILVNWRIFGSNGHRELTGDLVTERCIRAEQSATVRAMLTPFRSIFRTDAYRQVTVHQPRDPEPVTQLTCNGSGLKETEFTCKTWRANDPGERRYAQVNRYVLRDLPSFLLRHARNSAKAADRDVALRDWQKHDHNDDEDLTLATRAFDIRAEMKRLNEMSDGKLFRMRQRGLRQWRMEYGAALKDENMVALRDSILAATSAAPMREPFKLPGTSQAVFKSVRARAEPLVLLKRA